MAFASYNEFRAAMMLMIDGDEVSSIIQPATVDLLVSLGEALVHYGNQLSPDGRILGPLRASSMLEPLSGVVAGNACTLPGDLLELQVVTLDGGVPLEAASQKDMDTRLPWMRGGVPRKFSASGDGIAFSPIAADGAALGGFYYAKPAPLKDGLHDTFNRYPELYLYAALFSSAPFLGQDRRIPVWQAYYATLLDTANQSERTRVSDGGRLRMVAR